MLFILIGREKGGRNRRTGRGNFTTTSRPALIAAIVFSAFSYASARFQYAAARQPKAKTRVKKMRKKTMLVRREQMRKMKQMSPVYAEH